MITLATPLDYTMLNPPSEWIGWWVIPLEKGDAYIPPNQITYEDN